MLCGAETRRKFGRLDSVRAAPLSPDSVYLLTFCSEEEEGGKRGKKKNERERGGERDRGRRKRERGGGGQKKREGGRERERERQTDRQRWGAVGGEGGERERG